ncbi:hypothetical protein ACN27J_23570 [Solwaraspora sp. WMMB762]|uniref:hypothetical protein n=1 Tax=Solwaraspora sp. WMMB762 TaxID=3404120 RepID=UPI003B95493D
MRTLLTLDDAADVPTVQEDIPPEDQLWVAALTTSLFVLAVQRQYPEGASRGEIIRFVAELRAALPAGTSVDARATEEMITSVVDAKRREEIPYEVAAESVMEVLQYLLDPAKIGTDELEAALARAIAFAEEHGLDAHLKVKESYGSQS